MFFSVLVGVVCGLCIRNSPWALILGGAIPWCGFLALLLYNEYFVPYQGGGASMWPIALIFGGSAAACVGALAAGVVQALVRRKVDK